MACAMSNVEQGATEAPWLRARQGRQSRHGRGRGPGGHRPRYGTSSHTASSGTSQGKSGGDTITFHRSTVISADIVAEIEKVEAQLQRLVDERLAGQVTRGEVDGADAAAVEQRRHALVAEVSAYLYAGRAGMMHMIRGLHGNASMPHLQQEHMVDTAGARPELAPSGDGCDDPGHNRRRRCTLSQDWPHPQRPMVTLCGMLQRPLLNPFVLRVSEHVGGMVRKTVERVCGHGCQHDGAATGKRVKVVKSRLWMLGLGYTDRKVTKADVACASRLQRHAWAMEPSMPRGGTGSGKPMARRFRRRCASMLGAHRTLYSAADIQSLRDYVKSKCGRCVLRALAERSHLAIMCGAASLGHDKTRRAVSHRVEWLVGRDRGHAPRRAWMRHREVMYMALRAHLPGNAVYGVRGSPMNIDVGEAEDEEEVASGAFQAKWWVGRHGNDRDFAASSVVPGASVAFHIFSDLGSTEGRSEKQYSVEMAQVSSASRESKSEGGSDNVRPVGVFGPSDAITAALLEHYPRWYTCGIDSHQEQGAVVSQASFNAWVKSSAYGEHVNFLADVLGTEGDMGSGESGNGHTRPKLAGQTGIGAGATSIAAKTQRPNDEEEESEGSGMFSDLSSESDSGSEQEDGGKAEGKSGTSQGTQKAAALRSVLRGAADGDMGSSEDEDADVLDVDEEKLKDLEKRYGGHADGAGVLDDGNDDLVSVGQGASGRAGVGGSEALELKAERLFHAQEEGISARERERREKKVAEYIFREQERKEKRSLQQVTSLMERNKAGGRDGAGQVSGARAAWQASG